MNSFVENLSKVEKHLSREKGPLNLFAAFLRTDIGNQWDLVVSANWIKDEYEGLAYVSGELNKFLTKEDILKIARVVVLETKNEFVGSMNKSFKKPSSDPIHISNCSFNEVFVREGFIFSSLHEKHARQSATV